MPPPLNLPEQPERIPQRPHCAQCGDVIGAYEPMILVEDGKPRRSAVSAERDEGAQTVERYHAACYSP